MSVDAASVFCLARNPQISKIDCSRFPRTLRFSVAFESIPIDDTYGSPDCHLELCPQPSTATMLDARVWRDGNTQPVLSSFLPQKLSEIRYFTLGLVSGSAFHSLFVLKQDAVLQVSDQTTLRRADQDPSVMNVNIGGQSGRSNSKFDSITLDRIAEGENSWCPFPGREHPG
jgi:hypothetical protein